VLENERAKIVINHLFNSTTKPIPPVRRDIQIIPVKEDGRDLLLFYDPMKISEPGFALDGSVEPLLSLIDGHKSLTQLASYFGKDVSGDQLLEFVQMLDQRKLLESPNFKAASARVEEQFENSGTRQPALSDSSYPSEPDRLLEFMNNIMNGSNGLEMDASKSKALYAPHIDLRVGSEQYAEAFSLLRGLKPKRVVILATSHYSGYYPELYNGYPFIGSQKDFILPGRTIKTDQKAVQTIAADGEKAGFTLKDRAHRIEHSIETHLLFASHIWKHDFEIVPVLIAGIDDLFYIKEGDLGNKIENFASRLQQIDTDDTFYLISGDLSHVGRKFGDTVPAAAMRSDVETFDREFITAAESGNHDVMLRRMAENYDPYRICGFPPLFTFIKSFPGIAGKQINYHWWDEQERESAVSFGSILY